MTYQTTSRDQGCAGQTPRKAHPHRLCPLLHGLYGALAVSTCIAAFWRAHLSMQQFLIVLLVLAVSGAGVVILARWITPKLNKAKWVRSVTAPAKVPRRWASVAFIADIGLVLGYGLLLGRWLFLDNVTATTGGMLVSVVSAELLLALLVFNVIAHIRASVKTT
ncbi:hypothetical protein RB621_03430 [Streptomyces californicus]|nr:hypothetical protein [Streptomyces californicus]